MVYEVTAVCLVYMRLPFLWYVVIVVDLLMLRLSVRLDYKRLPLLRLAYVVVATCAAVRHEEAAAAITACHLSRSSCWYCRVCL